MEKEKQKKKAWYQIKIEELEAKIAELSILNLNSTVTVSSSPDSLITVEGSETECYADGYVDCMHKYGILSKVMRRRVHENIMAKGIGAVKGTKRQRFSISVPSV